LLLTFNTAKEVSLAVLKVNNKPSDVYKHFFLFSLEKKYLFSFVSFVPDPKLMIIFGYFLSFLMFKTTLRFGR
jgi:hypothetical protein